MRQYLWKNYNSNIEEVAVSSQNSSHDVAFESLPDKIKKLVKSFCVTYSTVQIPILNRKVLEDLLALYDVNFTLDELITIGCSLQYERNLGLEINEDEALLKDFELERESYKLLLDVLEGFLFAENHKNLHSVLFKFNQGETKKVNNFFVVKDILEAICIGYGIDKANFYTRKTELLESTNKIILSKVSEKVKVDFAQVLYCVLAPKLTKKADRLKFIGTFFHIFQVQVNNNDPIEYSENILDTIKSVDLKNLKHYVDGRTKLFYN